jgi:hypothetical protein
LKYEKCNEKEAEEYPDEDKFDYRIRKKKGKKSRRRKEERMK